MTRVMPADLARLLRRVALPLGWYYVVTLALPLANGAAQSGAAFAGHALVVLVVPLIGIACAWAFRASVKCLFSLAKITERHSAASCLLGYFSTFANTNRDATLPPSCAMRVRLTVKLAEVVEGVDLSRFAEGDLIDLPQRDAALLIRGGWAEQLIGSSTGDRKRAYEPVVRAC